MSLNWYESCDALDNTMWEAPGPYTDELGSPEFLFRLCPALIADAVVWQDRSDQELSTPLRRGRTWDTLEEAKAELEKEASEMVVGACPERIDAGVKVSQRPCLCSSLTRETGEGLGLVKVDLDSLVPKGFQMFVSPIEGVEGCNRGGDAFKTEYLCEPASQIPARLWELAEEYHGRTEEFDRGVCTGPIERGAVMPANGREMGLIRRNAGELRSALREVAQAEGFSAQELDSAIGAVGVEFSYDAWLKKQQMGMS